MNIRPACRVRWPIPCLLLLCCQTALAQEVTSPADHLGRPVGRDFELADWQEVQSYYRTLATESPRVLVEKVGVTTEGRDFLLATVSSKENLARLDAIRTANARLADPRGLSEEERQALLGDARLTLFISLGMHSTETAAPQFGMEFVHQLATSEAEPFRSVREKMVVLIAPCLNPDGLDHVVSWYRETVGTPYEGTGLLRLYQLYSGHDNNRDWFMLSQAETRIVSRLLYKVWRPQVYWDVHQQGRTGERMFVPPFRDPLNPNLDPSIIAGIDALGSRALLDMTNDGHSGVSTGVSYDMWWNGGNRNVPVRHNIIGLLTEAASVNIASPVFLRRSELRPPGGLEEYAPSNRFPSPWPGGWWRIRDIIDYEHSFGRSLLGSLSREPRTWLENALGAAQRNLYLAAHDAPVAWIIPADNPDRGATRRLVDSLLQTGVEIHAASADFQADDRNWPAGSLVILRRQPYGDHVKDLFEVQRYPDGVPPYDVTGWTLPLLLGVRRVEVMAEFEAELTPVTDPEEAIRAFPGRSAPALLDSRDSDSWRAVFQKLAAGDDLYFVNKGKRAGYFLESTPFDSETAQHLTRAPRIGLYTPWSGSMDEGWLRYVLDTFDVPYVRVRNEMIRAGELGDFVDVLLLPHLRSGQLDAGRADGSVPERFARGLDPEGAAAIEEFVRSGGGLIAIGSSTRWAIDLMKLPIKDVTRGEGAGEFSCPGSVLRAVPTRKTRFTIGLPESMALFFSSSAAFEITGDPKDERHRIHLTYAPTRTLLSGYISAPEVIAGKAAWVRARHGSGSVHLFGFRPQYRSWSQQTFQLLFRAMLLDRTL